jgi:hypothetical protein
MPQTGFFRISPTIRLFDRHALFVNKVFTVLDLRFAQASDRIAQIDAANPHLRDKIRGELQKLRQTLDPIDPRWTGASYYQQQERQILNEALQNFVMEQTRSWSFFKGRGWSELPVPYLVSIAEVFSHKTSIPMDREAKRRKRLLFQWLEEHWDECLPYAEQLELEYADDGEGEPKNNESEAHV